MEQLFQTLHQQLSQGETLMLLSVIRAHGSAPRGPGAHMLVGSSGILTGTIGGGALEHTALTTAMEWLSSHSCVVSSALSSESGTESNTKSNTKQNTETDLKSQVKYTSESNACSGDSNPNLHFLRHFILNTEEAQNLGMVCGGNVDVLFTPFLPDQRTFLFVNRVLSGFQKRERFCIALPINEVPPHEVLPSIVEDPMWTDIMKPKFDGQPFGILSQDGQQIYIEQVLDNSRVFIFGGGHVSKNLVPLLAELNFRCIVSDDRAEFSNTARFPDAEEVHTVSFLDLESHFSVKADDYIVILTRGHQWDKDVQKFALKTPAKYIGVIGSRRKHAAVTQALLQEGFSQTDIDRVISPIGLDIGAQTPAEIAVSIAAQLIAVKYGKLTDKTAEKFRI